MLFKGSGISRLIVFLGNPGPKYAGTRHNVGFMTADVLEKKTGAKINKAKFRALTAKCTFGGESVMLMKPQTYMNLSGQAVAECAKFYKLPPENVLVVCDDVSLPCGKLRFRAKGSAGGHNGLKSIISCLGSDAFPRLKIGVGSPPHPDFDMADWVLGVFRGDDAAQIAKATETAAEAIECFVRDGADRAMNRYN